MTAAPPRIRLSRAPGWRLPEGAVVVARPTKWGNPFAAGSETVRQRVLRLGMDPADPVALRRGAAALFHDWMTWKLDTHLAPAIPPDPTPLRGRTLACWCPCGRAPDGAFLCHADVLLHLANLPESSNARL